jgi:hypothetical protein
MEGAMLSQSELVYHVERAESEFELARRASTRSAAEAHRKLSALHLEYLKQLDELCNGEGSRR